MLLMRQLVGNQTCGDRGASLDRLLIETGPLLPFAEDSVRSNGHKCLAVRPVLCCKKPLKRFEYCRNHSLVFTVPSGQNERLRQSGVRVGEALLEPLPRLGCAVPVNLKEAI